jgi:hypothetical protein
MKHFILLFIILFSSFLSRSEWKHLPGGPYGTTDYTSFAISNGNKYWATTKEGLYYSNNQGVTWQRQSLSFNNYLGLAAEKDTVMAIKQIDYDLYFTRSNDNGVTWTNTLMTNLPTTSYHVKICKGINRIDLLIDENGFVFSSYYLTSTDGGLSFNYPASSINKNVYHFQKYGNSILEYNSDSILPFNLDYTVISFDDLQSIAYIDSNKASRKILTVRDSTIIYFDSITKTIRYTENLFNSSTFGDTLAPNLIANDAYGLRINDSFILLSITDTNGFFKYYKLSSNKGHTWTIPSQNLHKLIQQSFGSQLYWSNNSIKLLMDNYLNFDISNDTFTQNSNVSKAFNTNKMISDLGCLYIADYSKLLKSCDNGLTFQRINSLFESYNKFTIHLDTIVCLSQDTTYYSYNGGSTWNKQAIPNSNSLSFGNIISLEFKNNLLFAQTSWNPLIMSSNFGVTWDTVQINLGTGSLTSANDFFNNNDSIFTNYGYPNSKIGYFDFNLNEFKPYYTYSAPNLEDVIKVGNLFISDFYSHTFPLSSKFSLDGVNWYLSNNNVPANNIFLWSSPKLITPVYINNTLYAFYLDTLISSTDNGLNWKTHYSNTIPMFNFNSDYDTRSLINHNGILVTNTFPVGVLAYKPLNKLLSGYVYLDNNNNGIMDIGEKGLQNIIVKGKHNTCYTDTNGHYIYNLDSYPDTLRPQIKSNVALLNPNYLIADTFLITNNNLGVHLLPNQNNFKVDITNLTSFNRGFPNAIIIKIDNLGSVKSNSTLVFNLDTNLIYISSDLSPSNINNNTYSWALDSLGWNESKQIKLLFTTNLNSTIGDPVEIVARLNTSLLDLDSSNNASIIIDSIVGAFDPNDKTCLQGNSFTTVQLAEKKYLEYVIRFENEGNFPTTFINIKDTLSHHLNIATLELVNSSHPVTITNIGNAINFEMNPCNLLPKTIDSIASKGFIKYRIQPKSILKVGDLIDNTAFIYFDYNDAIVTNTTQTSIVVPTPLDIIKIISKENNIKIYPNPCNSVLNIEELPKFLSKNSQVSIFNLQGQKIFNKSIEAPKFAISIKDFAKGGYLLLIKNENGKVLTKKTILFQ